jgi:hypothetical protein
MMKFFRLIFVTTLTMILTCTFLSAQETQKQQYRLVAGEPGVYLPFGMPKVCGGQTVDIYLWLLLHHHE